MVPAHYYHTCLPSRYKHSTQWWTWRSTHNPAKKRPRIRTGFLRGYMRDGVNNVRLGITLFQGRSRHVRIWEKDPGTRKHLRKYHLGQRRHGVEGSRKPQKREDGGFFCSHCNVYLIQKTGCCSCLAYLSPLMKTGPWCWLFCHFGVPVRLFWTNSCSQGTIEERPLLYNRGL